MAIKRKTLQCVEHQGNVHNTSVAEYDHVGQLHQLHQAITQIKTSININAFVFTYVYLPVLGSVAAVWVATFISRVASSTSLAVTATKYG